LRRNVPSGPRRAPAYVHNDGQRPGIAGPHDQPGSRRHTVGFAGFQHAREDDRLIGRAHLTQQSAVARISMRPAVPVLPPAGVAGWARLRRAIAVRRGRAFRRRYWRVGRQRRLPAGVGPAA
jgi:hypothetical protein